MNKDTEIAKMRDFAAALGKRSYCGPWLSQMMPFIESAIRSDLCPSVATMTLEEFRIHRQSIIDKANEEAAAIVEKAHKDSDRTIEIARQYRDGTAESLRRALRELER